MQRLEVGVESSSSKPARDPFSAALDALRDKLRRGSFVLGEPLKIADLARDLSLSATPVREALSRLAGEGLIHDRRGRGYFAQRIDSVDLAELYGLRRLYLQHALEIVPEGMVEAVGSPPEGFAPGEVRLDAVLKGLIHRTGDRTLGEAYRRIEDRLAPAVRIEAHLFPAVLEVERLASEREVNGLRVVIEDLHETRRGRVSDLLRLIRANIGSV